MLSLAIGHSKGNGQVAEGKPRRGEALCLQIARKRRGAQGMREGHERDARGTPEAYITPLTEKKVARLLCKRRGAQGTQRDARETPERRQREARGTPKAYITPL